MLGAITPLLAAQRSKSGRDPNPDPDPRRQPPNCLIRQWEWSLPNKAVAVIQWATGTAHELPRLPIATPLRTRQTHAKHVTRHTAGGTRRAGWLPAQLQERCCGIGDRVEDQQVLEDLDPNVPSPEGCADTAEGKEGSRAQREGHVSSGRVT